VEVRWSSGEGRWKKERVVEEKAPWNSGSS
jgi:hypothetical protein